ncbi:MAG: hypothetical protein WEB78_09815 [Ilumatobacteraceae bacterium]
MAHRVVDDLSHEGIRTLVREDGVSLQLIKTFKASNVPGFEAKKNRIWMSPTAATRAALSINVDANSTLHEDDAVDLAVEEVRAVRRRGATS